MVKILDIKPDAVFDAKRFQIEIRNAPQGTENVRSGVYFRNVRPFGSVIIPEIRKGVLCLQRQFRHQIGEFMLEFPLGGAEPNENSMKNTAIRELKEEAHLKAKEMKFLHSAFTDPGTSTALDFYFLARDLKKVGSKSVANEKIEPLQEYKIDDLLRMIKRNEIRQNETISGILYYAQFEM